MRQLTDFIMVTEPLLTPSALTDILTVTEGVEWRTPVQYEGAAIRNCTTFPVSGAVSGGYPCPHMELAREVDATLLSTTLRALRIYKAKHPCHTNGDSGFDILRYEQGQFIGPHVDDQVPRILSISIALNDDYDGGEFHFIWGPEEGGEYIRLAPGAAILFPANFMFPHEITPVTRGTRYSMITWIT